VCLSVCGGVEVTCARVVCLSVMLYYVTVKLCWSRFIVHSITLSSITLFPVDILQTLLSINIVIILVIIAVDS